MSKDIKRLKRELFRYLARTVPERGNACKAPEVEGRTVCSRSNRRAVVGVVD